MDSPASETERAGRPAAPPEGRWPDRDASPGAPDLTSPIYRAIVRWGNSLVRGYYRWEMRGAAFPDDAPVLLVQNHTNGLVDASFLMSANRRPIRILVKYKLMTTPMIGWMLRRMDAVPMYRKKDGVDTRQNAKSFEAIDRALAEGAVIALFPEGESLDAIALRDLRSGVARMALSAEEARPGLGVRIVPVGVTYEERDRYRTLASALIGPAIDPVAVAAADGGDKRSRTAAVLDATTEGLKALTLQADDEEQYRATVALERIRGASDAPLGIRRKAARAALLADAARAPEAAEARRREVTAIGEALATGRLSGDDVLADPPSLAATWPALLGFAGAAAIGGVAWAPPILGAWLVSRLRRTPDKLVTLRAIFAFVFFTGWAVVAAAALGVAFGPAAALAGLAFFAVQAWLWPRVMDGLVASKRRFVLRALSRRPADLGVLRDRVRSIREAFADAPRAAERDPRAAC